MHPVAAGIYLARSINAEHHRVAAEHRRAQAAATSKAR